jgi:Fe-S-cluster containining protein
MFSKARDFFSRLLAVFLGEEPRVTFDIKVKALKSLFDELDREVRGFRRQVGLVCPERCGHCCENGRVETTELEMLPMAVDLVQNGEAERFYDAADKLDFEGRCVFYEPDPGRPGLGRCGRYELRPLICRLFAFSGNADKYGRTRLIVCGIIKDADPLRAQRAIELVEREQFKPPVMAAYVMKASLADPELAREQLPINLALKRAIDRVWLHRKFGK